MISNENYEVSQGAALAIRVTLRDANGVPITSYDGTQTLTTAVWPGGGQAVSLTLATMWVAPESGLVQIALTDQQTSLLSQGRYRLLTRLEDSGLWVDAYGCTLDVLPVAASGLAPTTYTTFEDLLTYGRSWLRQLQSDDDQAGFAEQQGRARSWIEDLAHAHFRVATMAMVIGSQAFGPRRSGARSSWLQTQLDADTLMVTDQLREAAAKKALAFICEGQIGLNDSAAAYARLAKMYHSQADYLGTCLTLSLDTNGDGFPDVNIDCSCTDPLYG